MEKFKERTKAENFILISKYPWLKPDTKDYDYSYTLLDELPDGWNFTFGEQLCAEIAEVLAADDIKPEEYYVFQVKEKYGTLRWYDNFSTDKLNAVIDKYEELSTKICLLCGKSAKYRTQGWISYICEDCFNKEKNYLRAVPIDG